MWEFVKVYVETLLSFPFVLPLLLLGLLTAWDKGDKPHGDPEW